MRTVKIFATINRSKRGSKLRRRKNNWVTLHVPEIDKRHKEAKFSQDLISQIIIVLKRDCFPLKSCKNVRVY